MQMSIGLFVFLSMAACAFTHQNSDRPSYIECTSNDHCDPGYCCSIAREKYSYPTCKPMQVKGEICRLSSPRINETFYYPDGLQVTMNNVYLNICPCAEGLICDRVDRQCHEA